MNASSIIKTAGAVVALTFATIAILLGPEAMALFKNKVLFSKVEGQVLLDGKPVAGAHVVQSAQLSGEEPVSFSISTNGSGHFTLEAITSSGRMIDFLPTEVAISQTLLIKHGNKEYEGWVYTKRNYDSNGELDGRPLKLVCDLSNEADFVDKYYGVCRVIS